MLRAVVVIFFCAGGVAHASDYLGTYTVERSQSANAVSHIVAGNVHSGHVGKQFNPAEYGDAGVVPPVVIAPSNDGVGIEMRGADSQVVGRCRVDGTIDGCYRVTVRSVVKVAPACNSSETVQEYIAFIPLPASYSRHIILAIVPTDGNSADCAEYIATLTAALTAHQGPPLWQAAFDTGALAGPGQAVTADGLARINSVTIVDEYVMTKVDSPAVLSDIPLDRFLGARCWQRLRLGLRGRHGAAGAQRLALKRVACEFV